MRARWVRRTGGVHNRKLVLVKERLERREARVQSEESVQVDRRVRAATLRLGNRNCGPHAVVIGLAKRHNNVQAVSRAALKQHDELLLVRHRRRGDGALQKRGHRAEADHGHAALLQKIPPREFQTAYTLTASITHSDLSHLSPLKFRRAQHQTCDDAKIHLLARIVELRLQNLRTIELLLERLDRRRPRLPAKKYLYRAI